MAEQAAARIDTPPGVEIRGPVDERYATVLTRDALEFLAGLHRAFEARRQERLRARTRRQAEFDRGVLPDFLPETKAVREDMSWRVAPPSKDLRDRRCEITGPTDRKMVINALNSGARVFMADFEDSNSPTWENMVLGHVNLTDAIERTISLSTPDGKSYTLGEHPAVLIVRPRGWHLNEKHLLVDGTPISGALFDFGLYFFRNAKRLIERGSGPYYYLPKQENHLEARLWNDVFVHAQEALGVPRGTIRATVLIETITAAFEMEEILYELREHSAGLNAGRWDYMFSIIKKFRNRPEFVFPDRNSVTMAVPFMRAYTELLVKTCHRRGAHAIGGMAAFIPSRRDPEINARALERVRDDKRRESSDGFDGSWVAHPDLVPVCTEVFDAALGSKPNQVERLREEVSVAPHDLLDVKSAGGTFSEAGLRNDVSVGLQYIESWLRGTGAAGIYNLMEDVATAEISRSQVWQWVRNQVRLEEGALVDAALVRRTCDEEIAKIRGEIGEEAFAHRRFDDARKVFEEVALADDFVEFLTLSAYEQLP
ncbi:MAG TPA: malate synthase A [Candidatus Dormibacteraeota bacterium]|nr:malate synthase A [Candidatus Dormibacteraeota bacterium]